MKLRNARRMSFGEYLAPISGMEISMQSHLEVNFRFGRDLPRGELVDCDDECRYTFWWVECLEDHCQLLWQP